jgi:hypothetical protein
MYLRFVLPHRNPDSGVREGIFSAAYELRDSGEPAPADLDELTRLLRWFGDNLTTPTRFNRTKSKGYYRHATKGISWLKPSATEHLSNMRKLVGILERYGRQATMIKTRNPGYVVYEDDHQIVAEPFNDTCG